MRAVKTPRVSTSDIREKVTGALNAARIVSSIDEADLRHAFKRVLDAARQGGAAECDLQVVQLALDCLSTGKRLVRENERHRQKRVKPIIDHNERRQQPDALKRAIRDLDRDLKPKYPNASYRYSVIQKRIKTDRNERQIRYICTGK